MAKKKIKPKPAVAMVTDSCGCVFCDLDLEPEAHESTGEKYHRTRSGDVPCTKPMKF